MTAEQITVCDEVERTDTDGDGDEIPSLRHLIRDCCSESGSTDLDVVVKEVFGRIDPADYGRYLQALLRGAVRDEWRDLRAKALNPPAPRSPSSKVEAIRQVRALLDARVNIGGSTFKRPGDCGTADLLAACQAMRSLAAQHARRASTYENLAGLLARHRVNRVEDLPSDVLSSFRTAS